MRKNLNEARRHIGKVAQLYNSEQHDLPNHHLVLAVIHLISKVAQLEEQIEELKRSS